MLLTPNQPRIETPMETESTTKDTTTISDKLLLLRKDYKKTSVAMAKARYFYILLCRERSNT